MDVFIWRLDLRVDQRRYTGLLQALCVDKPFVSQRIEPTNLEIRGGQVTNILSKEWRYLWIVFAATVFL